MMRPSLACAIAPCTLKCYWGSCSAGFEAPDGWACRWRDMDGQTNGSIAFWMRLRYRTGLPDSDGRNSSGRISAGVPRGCDASL
jgi:hypothetical protein